MNALIRFALLGELKSGDPVPAGTLVREIAQALRIDPQHVIAAAWDLVEDDLLTYASNSTYRLSDRLLATSGDERLDLMQQVRA